MGILLNMIRFLVAISVLAVATAADEKKRVESPFVGGPTNFPDHGWEISDWVNGLIIGTYGPLAAYARNDDCFSSWFMWGSIVVKFSKYFDKGFDVNGWASWLFLTIQMIALGLRTSKLPRACKQELKQAKLLDWHEDFGFLSADVQLPPSKYNRDSTRFNVLRVVALILGALPVWGAWRSKYYYWELGQAMGNLASVLFVGIDVWSGANLIKPEPAWYRYNDTIDLQEQSQNLEGTELYNDDFEF